MNRQRLALTLVALCCVLALGMVAATLNSPSRIGTGDQSGQGDAIGDGERFNLGSINATSGPGSTVTIPPIVQRILLAVTVLLGLASLYVTYQRYGLDDLVTLALVAIVVLVFVFVFIQAVDVLQFSDLGGMFLNGEFSLPSELGEAGEEAASTGRVLEPPVAVLGLLVLVLFVGVAVVIQTDPGVARAEMDVGEEDPPPGSGAAAVGRAAGRAADDVAVAGDPDVSNAVYRAWHEMTDALDVDDPETSTPGEFAAAAVEAGLAPEDVEELTGLFEEVRYGDTPPTPDRERRAIEVLRRIERAYAGEEE